MQKYFLILMLSLINIKSISPMEIVSQEQLVSTSNQLNEPRKEHVIKLIESVISIREAYINGNDISTSKDFDKLQSHATESEIAIFHYIDDSALVRVTQILRTDITEKNAKHAERLRIRYLKNLLSDLKKI